MSLKLSSVLEKLITINFIQSWLSYRIKPLLLPRVFIFINDNFAGVFKDTILLVTRSIVFVMIEVIMVHEDINHHRKQTST